MPGKRKANPLELPKRVYKRGLTFYYVWPGGRWESLGRDIRHALRRANEIASGELGEVTPADYDEVYWRAMKSATARKIAWSLSTEEFAGIVKAAGGRCTVTGMKFLNTKPAEGRRRPWMPSLDRIDNGVGYTRDNVRLVSVAVNIGRSDFGDDVWRQVMRGFRRSEAANVGKASNIEP